MTSRPLKHYAVFGFGSTHDALDGEQLLDDMGVEVVPIPAPKSIGALCGIALRIPADEAERAAEYLLRAELTVTARAEIDDV